MENLSFVIWVLLYYQYIWVIDGKYPITSLVNFIIYITFAYLLYK